MATALTHTPDRTLRSVVGGVEIGFAGPATVGGVEIG